MEKYGEYFMFDRETILDYVRWKLDYFSEDEDLQVEEIGDGNINYVYRIRSKSRDRSLIVKQADKLLRSSQRPLDVKRNFIEAEVLEIQYQLTGGMTPKVYSYDEKMNAILMEDIGDYKNLRLELLDGKVYSNLAEDISSFLVDSLLPGTDIVLDPYKKKDRLARYINKDMCDISEDLVFTEPFNDYKGRNIILDENLDFVKEHIYGDADLHLEAARLKNRFKNYSQALIHGDLHSGSIFINERGIKVIDPEFAFYGPIGYDLGNVLGNLTFPLVRSYLSKDRTYPHVDKFQDYLEGSLIDIFDLFQEKFQKKIRKEVQDPISKSESFLDWYLRDILEDGLAMAGLEILRRTIGDSKVEDITSIEDRDERILVERALILLSKDLIKSSQEIRTGRDYLDLILSHIK